MCVCGGRGSAEGQVLIEQYTGTVFRVLAWVMTGLILTEIQVIRDFELDVCLFSDIYA